MGMVNTNDSRELLAHLELAMRSDEQFSQLLQDRGATVVNEIYAAVLGRSVDKAGLAAYADLITTPAAIGNVTRTLIASTEFSELQRLRFVEPAPRFSPSIETALHVDRIFQRYARRAASGREVAACLSANESIGQSLPRVLAPAIKRRDSDKRKILLFGAYGNGNIGDAYQALALQNHLRECWGLDESQIFATSIIALADYPFPGKQKLPAKAILNTELVNEFDCLVIGGGGLLAHPHDPLFDEQWVKKLRLPVGLLAVGANTALIDKHRALIEKAWFVSGRDTESLSALRSVRPDAFQLRDPILCAPGFGGLIPDAKQAEQQSAASSERPVLWILKHPNTPDEISLLRSIGELIGKEGANRHTVVAVEPLLDRVLEEYFPFPIRFTTALADLIPLFERAPIVVSMRYHGAIFAAMAGKPCVGYAQKKIKDLYAETGLAGCYSPDAAELAAIIENAREAQGQGVAMASDLTASFRAVLKKLPDSHLPILAAVEQYNGNSPADFNSQKDSLCLAS